MAHRDSYIIVPKKQIWHLFIITIQTFYNIKMNSTNERTLTKQIVAKMTRKLWGFVTPPTRASTFYLKKNISQYFGHAWYANYNNYNNYSRIDLKSFINKMYIYYFILNLKQHVSLHLFLQTRMMKS